MSRPVLRIALRELDREFTDNCRFELTQPASELVHLFFDRAVLGLLRQRKIEWDGQARRFCMAAAAGLGRATDKRAKAYGVARYRHVRESLDFLVDYWEEICPLPAPNRGNGDEDDIEMLKTCKKLRDILAQHHPSSSDE